MPERTGALMAPGASSITARSAVGPTYSRSLAGGSSASGMRRDLRVAELGAHPLERLAGQQPLLRLAGARQARGLVARASHAEEDLPRPHAAGLREEAGLLPIEAAQLVVLGLFVLRLDHDRLDHGLRDVRADAAIALDQAELDAALHEQLLLDHAVEHAPPQLGRGGLARIALDALDQPLVVVDVEQRAVHGGDRTVRQAGAARVGAEQAPGGDRHACGGSRREPGERAARGGVGHGGHTVGAVPAGGQCDVQFRR